MKIYNVFCNVQLPNTYHKDYVGSFATLKAAMQKVKDELDDMGSDYPDDIDYKINMRLYTEHDKPYLEPIVFIELHELGS